MTETTAPAAGAAPAPAPAPAAPPAAAAAKKDADQVIKQFLERMKVNVAGLTFENNGEVKRNGNKIDEVDWNNGLTLDEAQKLGITIDEKMFYLIAHDMQTDKTTIASGKEADNVISQDDIEKFMSHASKYAEMLGMNPESQTDMEKVVAMYNKAGIHYRVITDSENKAHKEAVGAAVSKDSKTRADILKGIHSSLSPYATKLLEGMGKKTDEDNITAEEQKQFYARLYGLAFLVRDWGVDEKIKDILQGLYGSETVNFKKITDKLPDSSDGVCEGKEKLKKWVEEGKVEEKASASDDKKDHRTILKEYLGDNLDKPTEKLTNAQSATTTTTYNTDVNNKLIDFVKYLKAYYPEIEASKRSEFIFKVINGISPIALTVILSEMYRDADTSADFVELRKTLAQAFVDKYTIPAGRTGLSSLNMSNTEFRTSLTILLKAIQKDSTITKEIEIDGDKQNVVATYITALDNI